MAVRICVFLSQRDDDDNPLSANAEVVYETLIMPVMERFPDFRMNARGYVHETGEISKELLTEIEGAELVIADLTDLSSSGYFELGVRYSAGLPTVFIGDLDYVIPVDTSEFALVRYQLGGSPLVAGDPGTIDTLAAAIREALDTEPKGSRASYMPIKKTLRERRYELAERIEATAETIRLLRSNTTGDAITNLQAIAEELKSVEDVETLSALKEAAHKTLRVLFQIMDQLSTVQGARMAISGAIALVVGGAGWPATVALGLGLAFWEGKDAFLKAMEYLGKKLTW